MQKNSLETETCVLCTETEHFPYVTSEICTLHIYRTHSTSEMCTVHRNRSIADTISELCTVHGDRTISRRHIRIVYCAQKQNTFQTVHQKCVLYTDTEHIPDGTSKICTVHKNRNIADTISELCTVHRDRSISRLYIRNVYCAQ
jgi:DUF917 family protein